MAHSLLNTSLFVPPERLNTELWPKFIEILDYIASGAMNSSDFKDSKYKWTDPNQLSEEAIKEIIEERGYDYIRNVMEIVTGIDSPSLIEFISMISLLKGHRDGLELVLKLMQIEAIITEWWEVEPKREADTFRIELNFTTEYASVIADLGAKLRTFYRNYVYPKLEEQKIIFSDTMAEQTWVMAGYSNNGIGGELVDFALGAWLVAGYSNIGYAGTINGGVV